MNILRLSTLSLSLAIAVITLTIVLGSVAPRIAGAATGAASVMNFVTIIDPGFYDPSAVILCYRDYNTNPKSSDPKEELQAGMADTSTSKGESFRGIMPLEKAIARGLLEC